MQPPNKSLEDDVQYRVNKILEEMLGVHLPPQQPFMEAGLDSLGVTELRIKLCEEFDCDLPATVAFDFPNAASLAKFIVEKTQGLETINIQPSSLA